MSSANKDTIYIDIDDEITSIIEKVQNSPQKIVALVLPKRATMLQSIVNLKLLKRTGENSKKNLVLITSEAGLLPLAGAVGLHVAKTLQSKPEIPSPPKTGGEDEETIEDASDVDLDPNEPIGKLAGLSADEKDTEETIEMDDMEEEAPVTAKTKPKAKKKDRKLKVPDFNKFRTRLFLGIAGFILLIFLWYVAAYVMPSAHITIQTDTASINSDIQFTARPGLAESDLAQSIIPAAKEEIEKIETEKVPATGQKDVGKKSSGEVTLKLTNCSVSSVTIPSGTALTTSNLTFITKESATLQSVVVGPNCSNNSFPNISSKTVDVEAQNPGEQYNIGPATYSLPGQSNVSGQGTSMSGGTSQIIKIVLQEDVDGAKTKIQERVLEAAKTELTSKLQDTGFKPLSESITTGDAKITTSPNVGSEGTEVTVTAVTKYSLVGIKEEDLKKLIEESVKDDIDTSKQVVLDHGIDGGVFKLLTNESNGDVRFSLQTLVIAGPQLDEDGLKKEIRGKSKSETVETIKNRPGIRDVNIDYSPFWVFSTPRKEGKIKITFESLDETNNSDANNDGQ